MTRLNWYIDSPTVEQWAYIDNLFTPEEIKNIIDIGKNAEASTPIKDGTVGGDTEVDTKIRRSKISWIRSDVPSNHWIFRRITGAILTLNNSFFKYDLNEIQNIQFTSYTSDDHSGFYGKHIDTSYNGPGPRKLSISIQLSDPDSYEGGDLLLHNGPEPTVCKRDLGSLNMFPSWTLHEVTPVTKGTRYSLVVWIAGPRFK
jgi:PKHD-type hydroxylase